jgi:hypothetical protein
MTTPVDARDSIEWAAVVVELARSTTAESRRIVESSRATRAASLQLMETIRTQRQARGSAGGAKLDPVPHRRA